MCFEMNAQGRINVKQKYINTPTPADINKTISSDIVPPPMFLANMPFLKVMNLN